jgi:hypothetical protein
MTSNTARFLDVSTAEYHADPCAQPSLSASIARELIHKSPLHAWQVHPKLGNLQREETESASDGTLIHALMLGEGMDGIAVLDVKDFRTKAAQEARDAAAAAGKTVVKAADFAAAEIVADELKVRLARKGIKLTGSSEQKVQWTEETEEDGSVLCRGMIDHLVMHFTDVTGATIYDLKTIRSAHPKTVQRHILEYGYDIQEAAYRSAVGHIVPEAIGRIDLVFLFCEIEPPYDVYPTRLNGQWRAHGQNKWERACRTWAQCLKTDTWPGYSSGITEIEMPPWAAF